MYEKENALQDTPRNIKDSKKAFVMRDTENYKIEVEQIDVPSNVTPTQEQ